MIYKGEKESKEPRINLDFSLAVKSQCKGIVVINMKLLKQKKNNTFGLNEFRNYPLHWTKTLNIKILCPQGWENISW